MRSARVLLPLLSLALAFTAGRAAAAPQVWPFSFDPNLDPNPAQIQQQLTSGAASLPPLPVGELSTLTTDSGTMTLWLWPDNAALLTAIGASGPGAMTWPSDAVMCAAHAAFVMPALGGSGAGACAAAAAQIAQDVTPNLGACALTERPELYVYGYRPSDVAQDVGNVEDMIGLAGEALTHAGAPPSGILPPAFVPTLRAVLVKIRHDKLLAALGAASTGYAHASSALAANTSCFDPGAVASLSASLTALSKEVAAATALVQTTESAGEASAQHEAVCLAAHARARPALPYPGLTADERAFVAFWLGGLYWRMRGGGLIPLGSTQEARLYYVQNGFGQIAALVGGTDGQSNVGTPFFVEVLGDGWSQWQAMGTNHDDKYASLIGMTERGQRQAQSAINGLSPLGYDTAPLLTGGLQMGPGYYYAYYPLSAFRYGTAMPSPYSGFIDWPTAIGEFNVGAALGLGLAKTLLPGKPTGQPPTVDLCAGRACGDDGCGGSCGACPAGLACDASGQCGAPAPDAGPAPDDAGSARDAAPPPRDAAPPADDAGETTGDAPGAGTPAGAGCGCVLAGAPPGGAASGALFALGALALAGRARRRRA